MPSSKANAVGSFLLLRHIVALPFLGVLFVVSSFAAKHTLYVISSGVEVN